MRLGRGGMGRREIASALGLAFAELQAKAAAQPALATALERAEDEARAWREGLPREAMSHGKPFNLSAWREAMRARFEGWGEPQAAPVAYEPPARFVFPDNGTLRKPPPPDGLIASLANQEQHAWTTQTAGPRGAGPTGGSERAIPAAPSARATASPNASRAPF